MTDTFISILFLREESIRLQYPSSYLQDDSDNMGYSTSNPVCSKLHFSAHRRGDCVIMGSTCGLRFAQSSGFIFAVT